MATRRINAQDIAQAGSLSKLIEQLIDQVRLGNMETKEYGVSLLRTLTDQPSKSDVINAEAKKKPLTGNDDDCMVVPQYLDHGSMIANASGIKPLVTLLVIGSPAAQRDACGALANIARVRTEYQEKIIQAGGVIAMSALLRTGDVSAQEQAAAALASVSQSQQSHAAINSAGAVPALVNLLKANQRHEAQVHAAAALANLSKSISEVVAKAGAIPRILDLLAAGKALEAASRALAKLAHSNLANQTLICKMGGIPRLLPQLSGANVEAQVAAAEAIAELASGERCKRRQDAIAKAGGIRPLLSLVESRYNQAQCAALNALAELVTNNRTNQDAVATLEGVQPLVTLISGDSASSDVQTCAARMLAQLVKHNAAIQTSVADLGAISLLVSLIRQTNSPSVEAEVAGALYALGEGNPTNQESIVSAGAINVLVGLLGSRSDHAARLAGNALSSLGLDNQDSQREIAKLLVGMLTTAKREATQERAAAALWRLVRTNPSNQLGIAAAGGAAPLVGLLRQGHEGGRAFALWSLSLCICGDNRDVIVDEGAIGPLVASLKTGDMGVAEQAAGALAQLSCSEPRNVKTLSAIAEHGAIAPLIALLDQDESESARQHAAGALSELALLPSLRNTIDWSGGISPLVKVLTDPLERGYSKQFAAAAVGLLSAEDEEPSPTQPQAPVQQELQSPARATSDAGSAPPSPPIVPSEGSTPPTEQLGGEIIAPASPNPQTPQRVTAHAQQSPPRRSPRKTQIADEGAIAPLVALLRKGDAEQQEAAGALKALADDEELRLAITESGGIGPLVTMLGGTNPKARENAEGVLVRLSTEMANRVLIIQQLVGMLQDRSIAAREQAAAAIANLARESTANCRSIVDAGGIPPLLQLLLCESSKAKENSASALTQLASGSRPTQNAIAMAGGIPLLVGVLTASSTNKNDNSQGQLEKIVLTAIWNLAKKNFANQVALVEAGVIAPLVSTLGRAESPELQLPATGAIECLLQSRDIQSAVVRTGAIAPLCILSRDGMTETQEQAAAALWSLATDNAPNKTTIAKLGGIESLIKMVVIGGSEKSQLNAAGALSSLASKHAENRSSIAKKIAYLLADRGLLTVETPVATRALTALTRMCGRKMGKDRDEIAKEAAATLPADYMANQLAFAKAGAVNAIIGWLNSDGDVQTEAAHAVLAMATNNIQTQTLVAKIEGLQGLIRVLKGGCLEAQQHAAHALWHLAYDNENQIAIMKAGGIPALVQMLCAVDAMAGERAAEVAAVTMVRLAQGNPQVSLSIAQVGGIVPLVGLLKSGHNAAQQAAAALAELALVAKNRDAIANAGGIEPLIKLLNSHTIGTPETAARALAHLARNEEDEAFPTTVLEQVQLTQLADDRRVKAKAEVETGTDGDDVDNGWVIRGAEARRSHIMCVGGVTRLIAMLDGSNLDTGSDSLEKKSGATLWLKARSVIDETMQMASSLPSAADVGIHVGMMEQAAAALAELSFGDTNMQHAIIQASGVPKLLSLMISGSPLAQEFAAATISHLSSSVDNQAKLVDCGCIPELVALVRNGSPRAQEAACGALANLARGERAAIETPKVHAKVQKKASRLSRRRSLALSASNSLEEQRTADRRVLVRLLLNVLPRNGAADDAPIQVVAQCRLEQITDGSTMHVTNSPRSSVSASRNVSPRGCCSLSRSPSPGANLSDGSDSARHSPEVSLDAAESVSVSALADGIPPIVSLLGAKGATPKAKELAAAALWHLAFQPASRDLIAQSGGIAPLVGLLDGGTHGAHRYASDALARIANESREHQSQIAKRLVSLLMGINGSTVQRRAAHALQMLAADNPGSTVVIVKAGAISPLVHLLSTASDPDVKKEAGDALESLMASSDDMEIAVADLVVLLGTGSARAQELVLHSLLSLAGKDSNRAAISKFNALPKLVLQLDSSTEKVQQLAAAVISYLVKESQENASTIASQGGIPRLVALLSSSNYEAQANAAAVLADLSETGEQSHADIVEAGAISSLVAIISQESGNDARAEAASALACLAADHPSTQAVMAQLGAIEALVKLLKMEEGQQGGREQREAAHAITCLVQGSCERQNAVARSDGIRLLVDLLHCPNDDANAHAAAAIAQVACGNEEIQSSVAAANGIPRLVELLGLVSSPKAAKAASEALCVLAAKHPQNRVEVAAVGGILPLIMNLAQTNVDVQKATIKSLANLAEDNADNQATIATLLTKLLRNPSATGTAARAIAHLAQAGASMQRAFARIGAIELLVAVLKSDSILSMNLVSGTEPKQTGEQLDLQIEAVSALSSLGANNCANQEAIATAQGIPVLIALLSAQEGSYHGSQREPTDRRLNVVGDDRMERRVSLSNVLSRRQSMKQGLSSTAVGSSTDILTSDQHRLADLSCNAARALWNLAGNSENQHSIARLGGIEPLVMLLTQGNRAAQENASGALHSLAKASDARHAIGNAGGVVPLANLMENGSTVAKEQASACLSMLAQESRDNKEDIATQLSRIFSSGVPNELEHATEVARGLALEDDGSHVLDQAGLVPHLVRQVSDGTDRASESAALALGRIAELSDESRGAITQQLISLRHDAAADVKVVQRAGRALKQMNADEDDQSHQAVGMAILMFRLHSRDS